jgi:dTMP kinase
MEKGKFIVFEGIDGSGKSTHIRLLCEKLKAEGRRVYITAEPTSSVSGGLLRDALSGVSERSPAELAALFLLDRINHNVNPANGINKLTEEGYDVICDRYYYSSLAYQGSETDAAWVRDINLNCPEIRKPDVCIFLDLDAKTAMKRLGSDRAVTEIYEKESKLDKIRTTYLELFDALKGRDNIKIVNANAEIDKVADEIYRAVQSL